MRLAALQTAVNHLTDRQSNPFGLRPPFDRSDETDVPAVLGYGDPNADVHVIGAHPGVHGGAADGIPFSTGASDPGVHSLFRSLGVLSGDPTNLRGTNWFGSYLHMCTLPDGRTPSDEEYARLERYFDAELRAINAHILVPVGAQATDHVLRAYTTQRSRVDLDMSALHATEIRGRGFLVVPLAEPRDWDVATFETARNGFERILKSDYRQTKGVATRVG